MTNLENLPIEMLRAVATYLDVLLNTDQDLSIFRVMRVSRVWRNVVLDVHFRTDSSIWSKEQRLRMVQKMRNVEACSEWTRVCQDLELEEEYQRWAVAGMGGVGCRING